MDKSHKKYLIKVREKLKRYWKSQGILSEEKSGNPALLTFPGTRLHVQKELVLQSTPMKVNDWNYNWNALHDMTIDKIEKF